MYNWDKQAFVWTLAAPESVLAVLTPDRVQKISSDTNTVISLAAANTVTLQAKDTKNPRKVLKCLRKAHDMIMTHIHKQYTVLERESLEKRLSKKYLNDPRPVSLVRAGSMRKETSDKEKAKKNRHHRGMSAGTSYLHNPGEGENIVKGFGKR